MHINRKNNGAKCVMRVQCVRINLIGCRVCLGLGRTTHTAHTHTHTMTKADLEYLLENMINSSEDSHRHFGLLTINAEREFIISKMASNGTSTKKALSTNWAT